MEARRVTPSRRSGAPRSHLATIRCVKRRLKWWIGAKSVKLCKRRAHLSSSFSGGGMVMAGWTPDPTFYPSARMAMEAPPRSEEHTSELQSLMRISYAVFCLKKKKIHKTHIFCYYVKIQ